VLTVPACAVAIASATTGITHKTRLTMRKFAWSTRLNVLIGYLSSINKTFRATRDFDLEENPSPAATGSKSYEV
jgi:hypothetical protein